MDPKPSLEHLLHVLRTRHVPLTRQDVQWAFETKSTHDSVVNWVDQYLAPETLLSNEEVVLYSKLESNGAARHIAAIHELSIVRPLLEGDLKVALEALRSSTSEIEKQNEALKLQKEALSILQNNNTKAAAQMKRQTRQVQKKRAQEKQHVGLIVEELLQDITLELHAARRQIQGVNEALPMKLAETLNRDDKLLSKLERLSSELMVRNDCHDGATNKINALCTRLVSYTSDEIRVRLDRIYSAAVQCSETPHLSLTSNRTELEDSLQGELETPYTEIAAVAAMSVSQEFETPLTDAIKRNAAQCNDHNLSILDFIDATMEHVIEKTNSSATRTRNHHSHLLALSLVSSQLQGISQKADHGSMIFPSKSVERKNQLPPSPHKSTTPCAARLGSQTDVFQDIDMQSHRQLLALLGVITPEDTIMIQDFLSTAAIDHEQKTHQCLLNLNSSIDRSLSSHFQNTSIVQQLLVDALFADSNYHAAELLSESVVTRIDSLEAEIGKIGSSMAALDLDQLQMASKDGDEFVNRWSL